VLVVSAAMALAGALLGWQVEFRSSRTEMAPADDPDQMRWSSLLDEYSGSEALIACLEPIPGAPPAALAELGGLADRLAAEFRRDPRVARVDHRLDVAFIEDHSLYLVPPATLEPLLAALPTAEEMEQLGKISNLGQLNLVLAERIEGSFAEATGVPDGAADGVRALVGMIEGQREFLDDPVGSLEPWIGLSPVRALAGERAERLSDGYLKTHDGRTLFLFISPVSHDDTLEARRGLLEAMRERAAAILRDLPGYRVGFTGQPAMVVEEMDTIRSDTWLTSVLAVLGVSVLTTFVFRWRTHALLVLAALAAGICWSLGAVQLELGYLNMITSAFISTLVGVGVAYGIHPVSEYELAGAHTENPSEAVQTAFRRTGGAVTVAAVTTAVAFFSILLMRFKGFAELGLVAGVGVVLCLIAAMTTLPAMLVVYGRSRQRRRQESARRSSAVDRVWIETMAGRVCSRPGLVAVLALVVTGFAGWGALGLGFDSNILGLLPRNAESLRYQHRMAMESDLSPLFNVVFTDDLDSMRRMRERAAAEPVIDRFESLLDLLPPDPEGSRVVLARLEETLDRFELAAETTPLERGTLELSYRRLESALADAAEAAFGVGVAELAGPLEEARAAAEDCADRVAAAGEADLAAWNAAQVRTLEWTRGALAWARRALAEEPPTVETLPVSFRERFVTRNGRYLGFMTPVGSVFEEPVLDAFVAAGKRVSAEVTGFPVVFHKMSGRITQGFYRAVLIGFVLVGLVLFLDCRSPRDAGLASLPLVMGMVWMMGGMRLLGIPFNFANLVAVPLIIGVGIDNGVHVMHRVRLEGRSGMTVVLKHTGRAILIASLTTMIGFGSLALASHRGLASLGFVLLLGVGSCLITSTFVLPNLLVLFGVVER